MAMLSKRLKSNTRGNISRGLGHRMPARAGGYILDAGADYHEANDLAADAARHGGVSFGRRAMSRFMLVLALLLLPLCAWQGWEVYQDWTYDPTAELPTLPEIPETVGLTDKPGLYIPKSETRLYSWLHAQAGTLVPVLGQAVYQVGQARQNEQTGPAGAELGSMLAESLRKAYFDKNDGLPKLDRSAYYMLWREGTVICSPLSPETEGMDLEQLRDVNGLAFVAALRERAAQSGGYVFFTIEFADQTQPGGLLERFAPARVARVERSLGNASAAGKLDAEKGSAAPDSFIRYDKSFLAYAAPFEDTGYYLTVWRDAYDPAFSPAPEKKSVGLILSALPDLVDQVGLFAGLMLLLLSCLGFALLLRVKR